MLIQRKVVSALAMLITFASFESVSAAASREECVDAHSRAQDLREKGQLVKARQTFLTCAQSSCPSLVQVDCARFGEEIDHALPTVTFSARDGAAADLPNTAVFVDEQLLASRLDEGRAYEIDPGRHVVRYVHDGKETIQRIVLNQGEKGRLLFATFVDSDALRKSVSVEPAPEVAPKRSRSALPLVVAGLGAAAAVTGGALFAVGVGKVPDNCTLSSKVCAGPPNDPALADAKSGASLANIGLGIGIGGAVVLASSIVWYFVQPSGPSDSRQARTPQPLFTF